MGWVEPFAKPIAAVQSMMGVASLDPSALSPILRFTALQRVDLCGA